MKTNPIVLWLLLLCSAYLPTSRADAQCTCTTPLVDADNYSTAAPLWTIQQGPPITPTCPQTITIGPTVLTMNGTPDGRRRRAFRALNTPLNATSWTAEITMRLNANSNAPSFDLMAFTNGTLDAWANDASCIPTCLGTGCIVPTNQNAIMAYVTDSTTPGSATCCTTLNNNWRFEANSKLGTVTGVETVGIPVPALNTNYFVRLQRVSPTQGLLSVFSDAAMSVHIPQSPQCFPINAAIGTLNTVQHGSHPHGSDWRINRVTIDNLSVCDGNPCPLLTPSFTLAGGFSGNTYCANTPSAPIQAFGSALSSGNPSPMEHQWTVTEVDCSSTLPGPVVWTSGWTTGPPSFINLSASAPPGSFLCGLCYRVDLEVRNCGTASVAAQPQFITVVDCPVSVDDGLNGAACLPASVTAPVVPILPAVTIRDSHFSCFEFCSPSSLSPVAVSLTAPVPVGGTCGVYTATMTGPATASLRLHYARHWTDFGPGGPVEVYRYVVVGSLTDCGVFASCLNQGPFIIECPGPPGDLVFVYGFIDYFDRGPCMTGIDSAVLVLGHNRGEFTHNQGTSCLPSNCGAGQHDTAAVLVAPGLGFTPDASLVPPTQNSSFTPPHGTRLLNGDCTGRLQFQGQPQVVNGQPFCPNGTGPFQYTAQSFYALFGGGQNVSDSAMCPFNLSPPFGFYTWSIGTWLSDPYGGTGLIPVNLFLTEGFAEIEVGPHCGGPHPEAVYYGAVTHRDCPTCAFQPLSRFDLVDNRNLFGSGGEVCIPGPGVVQTRVMSLF